MLDFWCLTWSHGLFGSWMCLMTVVCVVCCLIYIHWLVSYSTVVMTETGSVRWICTYVCMYVCTRKGRSPYFFVKNQILAYSFWLTWCSCYVLYIRILNCLCPPTYCGPYAVHTDIKFSTYFYHHQYIRLPRLWKHWSKDFRCNPNPHSQFIFNFMIIIASSGSYLNNYWCLCALKSHHKTRKVTTQVLL
jgi:hypothetical protein